MTNPASREGPLLIALCGNPKAGKSTVQKIMQDDFGVLPVDDGRVLRDIGKMVFGLSEADVTTQAGKTRITRISDPTASKAEWENRDILGTIGNLLERTFGELVVPRATIRSIAADLKHASAVSFGSVRKRQGLAYLEQGGIVIEVVNPGVGPSPYDFDWYDPELVDFQIHNDGKSLEALRREVARILSPLLNQAANPYSKGRQQEHFDVV